MFSRCVPAKLQTTTKFPNRKAVTQFYLLEISSMDPKGALGKAERHFQHRQKNSLRTVICATATPQVPAISKGPLIVWNQLRGMF